MTSKQTKSSQTLRARAEQKLTSGASATHKLPSHEESNLLLHDLQVHQVELEMQNDELRLAQAELDAARARYFDLYDLAPFGYCTLSEQGLILEANLTAATLLGVARGALARQPITRFIRKEDQDIYYLHRRLLFETHSSGSGQAREPQVYELRMVKMDGTPFWGHLTTTAGQHADGAPVCRVVISDVTESKRAEQALRVSEQRFRDITFSMAEWAWEVDGNGAYTYSSQKGFDLFGQWSDDVIGKTPFDFMLPAEAKRIRAIFSQLAAHKAPIRDLENWNICKDGRVICLLTNGVPILDEQGNLKGYRGVDKDITGRKRAEEEKAKLEAQLHQSQKMELVGRLAGGVAHDFNNMLGVILGHAELAIGQVDPAEPICAHLVAIRTATNRSADLTRQLLAFARKQTIAPRVLDLNDTVAGMLKMLKRLIGEDIRLNWQPGKDVWPVKLDPSQIDQILANLCVNARDAIAGVGTITIETGNSAIDEDSGTDLQGCAPGEYVRLVVGDDGCGMDQETQGHIFEPFFTTKVMGKGTGLGLATLYGAVKQNDGFVTVFSEPGSGTTFTIYLPRHAGAARQAGAEGAAGPLLHGHETILLVEDEPDILDMTTEILERLGWQRAPRAKRSF
jgi:PAS domain S-box-containing protein